MKKTTMIIIAVIAVLVLWCISAYNGMVRAQEDATNEWANVQSTYQRRADLVPNLVETVKGYAKHEENTLKEVIEARAKATSINIDPSNCTPEQLAEYQKAQNELGSAFSSALGRLIAVSESYPDLKANDLFKDLQAQLEGTENRINSARDKFNDKVTVYNKDVRSFPNNIFAGIFGFRQMEKFQADADAQKKPEVKF